MTAAEAKARVFARASELGFDLVGVTSAESFEDARRVFAERAAVGYLAEWRYDAATIRRFCTPAESLPEARSIVCTAMGYYVPGRTIDPSAPGLAGSVSRYAWGEDYHRTLGSRLRSLARFIESEFGAACLPCVDTGPLVDRAAAVRAGIGWFGKNANVLTKEYGSWVLLGEVITSLDLPPDEPLSTNCGECAVCIDRCPTGAIGADGLVDARRCISDLTQRRTSIPRELRGAIGNRLWGCDDCQTPCPVNHRKQSKHAREAESPMTDGVVDLTAVLAMTGSQFRTWFGGSAMAWRGKAVLQRNAAVALGNSRDPAAVPHLIAALADRKAMVRSHAAWALGELGGDEAREALAARLASERDTSVRGEIETALARAAPFREGRTHEPGRIGPPRCDARRDEEATSWPRT